MNSMNINQAMFEVQQSLYYLDQYQQFQTSMHLNPILIRAQFMSKDVFVNEKKVEKVKVERSWKKAICVGAGHFR